MFDGEIEQITALFHISYLNIILDRFGDNVILHETEDAECFQATFKAGGKSDLSFMDYGIRFRCSDPFSTVGCR